MEKRLVCASYWDWRWSGGMEWGKNVGRKMDMLI